MALYAKMPVIPSRITGIIWNFFNGGTLPSIFQVSKIRSIEAVANLKKAIEKAPTFWETNLPAMKAPPQNIAVNNSFAYIFIANLL